MPTYRVAVSYSFTAGIVNDRLYKDPVVLSDSTSVAEEAKSGRAGCQNSECKHKDVKILKGELRFGNLINLPTGESSFKWKHWGCVTPFQISQWKEASEGDMDLVDGYEELPEDLQDKVKRAIVQGHVDDADWKGDVEANRDGKKGFRVSRPNTPKKVPGGMGDEDESDNGASPTKAAPKSRKRGVKREVDNEQTEAVKTKKARAHPVKTENNNSEDDIVPPKKAISKAKRAKDANDGTETKPEKKVIAAKKKVDKADSAPGAGPPKRTSGRTQKSRKYAEDEDEESLSGDEEPPTKKARASKKTVAPKDEEESEEASAPTKAKSGRKKKATDGNGTLKPAAKAQATKTIYRKKPNFGMWGCPA